MVIFARFMVHVILPTAWERVCISAGATLTCLSFGGLTLAA